MSDPIHSSTAETAVKQFTKNAELMYNRKWFTDEQLIERLVQFAGVDRNDVVVEFACGGGVVSATLAKGARRVVGIDITPKMIELSRERTATEHVVNVDFRIADCYETGLEPDYADVSLMRFALHHFHDPLRVLKEMRRITQKTNGRIVIEDVTSPSNELGSFYLNTLERFRDPSHSQMFSIDGIFSLFKICQIKPTKIELYQRSADFEEWMEHVSPSEETLSTCRFLLEEDIGRNLTGLDPKYDGRGGITFTLNGILIQGVPA